MSYYIAEIVAPGEYCIRRIDTRAIVKRGYEFLSIAQFDALVLDGLEEIRAAGGKV